MGEPTGLSQSLDDMIASQRMKPKRGRRNTSYGDRWSKDRHGPSRRGRVSKGGRHGGGRRDFQHSRNSRYGGRGRRGNEYKDYHRERGGAPMVQQQEGQDDDLVLLAGTLHGKLNIGLNKQECEMGEDGSVIIKYEGLEMVVIAPNGDVTINTFGRHERAVAKSISFTLGVIGIKLSTKNMQSYDDPLVEWNVSDGFSLMRFHDGIVIKGRGQTSRGKTVMDSFLALRRAKIPNFAVKDVNKDNVPQENEEAAAMQE